MKIDLHVHTSETSGCGKVPGAEMARLFHEAGYDAITITDHLIAGKNIDMPVKARVEWYLSGYHAAKAEGERLGLTVLLGAEARMSDGDEDFLLFGVQEDDIPWLMGLLDSGVREKAFYDIVHATGRFLLIQAHPFRQGLRQIRWISWTASKFTTVIRTTTATTIWPSNGPRTADRVSSSPAAQTRTGCITSRAAAC